MKEPFGLTIGALALMPVKPVPVRAF